MVPFSTGFLYLCCIFALLKINVLVYSHPAAAVFQEDFVIPGEPLNPDDLVTARKYLKDIEDGVITEEPDPNEPMVETVLRDNSQPLSSLWKSPRIPYEIDSAFTGPERGELMSAIHAFRIDACIVFVSKVPMEMDNDYLFIQKDKKDQGCTSFVGRQGGKQVTIMSHSCLKFGSIQHELMHVIGFDHEHMRPDRDQHVEIKMEYIIDELIPQFTKLEKTRNTASEYDIGSILHYSSHADCKNPCNKKTIIDKKNTNVEMGQRKGLSKRDREKIQKNYKCNAKDPMGVVNGVMPPIGGGGGIRGFESPCMDFDERCAAVVKESDCGKNHTWINFNCRKTCGTCNQGDCTDFNPKCEEWSRQNYCMDYPEYMLLYCRSSCGVCPNFQ